MKLRFSTEELVELFDEIFPYKSTYSEIDGYLVEIADIQESAPYNRSDKYKIEYLPEHNFLRLFCADRYSKFYRYIGHIKIGQNDISVSNEVYDDPYHRIFVSKISQLVRQKAAKTRRKFISWQCIFSL